MGQFRVCWTVPEDGSVPPLPPGTPVTARGYYADVTAADVNSANWAVAQLTSAGSTFTGTVAIGPQTPA